MKLARRRFLHLAGVGLTASTLSRTAWAQNYPTRPVKIIVPIGPAGSYDIVGRLLADQLTKRLGQSFLVENRPGAGAIIGTQAVVTAPRIPVGWLCRLDVRVVATSRRPHSIPANLGLSFRRRRIRPQLRDLVAIETEHEEANGR